ncbi:MAG TPA: nucleotide exchange factor GrpE [Treponemataceae bacterium]|nr:MAG: heat shock protein GrpE [Spirochaetes bacterium ADurb.Bin269]HOC29386.1 nucleotide exchange factor GrpE [Treponemataceae bacterium]HQL31677.1 nucleotide exchange factor GrpE [Treponemataceae bacterium]
MKKSAEHKPEEMKRESAAPGADSAQKENAGKPRDAAPAGSVSAESVSASALETDNTSDQEGTASAAAQAGASSDEKAGTDLTERIADLEKMNAQLQDQYLRKAADFDNYRKRMIREKQEAIDYANTNLLSDLVKVLDDFDRAIESGSTLEAGSAGAAFADGVVMIRSQLGGMLQSKYGLEYYPSLGSVFDPNIHEAIASHPSPEVSEPTVSEEFMKGYRLKDRIVRLAKVAVSMPAENAGD